MHRVSAGGLAPLKRADGTDGVVERAEKTGAADIAETPISYGVAKHVPCARDMPRALDIWQVLIGFGNLSNN